MTNKLVKTGLFHNRAFSIVLAVCVVVGALIVHNAFANTYYSLNSYSLQLAASMATRAGAQFLPLNPQAAIGTANRFVRLSGVSIGEIISIDVSDDDSTLTIRLRREIPEYVSLLAFGLPNRTIRVTASGEKVDRPSARDMFQTAAL